MEIEVFPSDIQKRHFQVIFTCTLVLYSHTFDKLYIYQNVLVSQTFQCLTYYVFPHVSIDLSEFTFFMFTAFITI